MTKSAEKIFQQAMALNEADRAELVDRLAEALEPSTRPEYLAAWEQEIKTRIADIDSGRAKMIPANQALHIIEQRDNGQTR